MLRAGARQGRPIRPRSKRVCQVLWFARTLTCRKSSLARGRRRPGPAAFVGPRGLAMTPCFVGPHRQRVAPPATMVARLRLALFCVVSASSRQTSRPAPRATRCRGLVCAAGTRSCSWAAARRGRLRRQQLVGPAPATLRLRGATTQECERCAARRTRTSAGEQRVNLR